MVSRIIPIGAARKRTSAAEAAASSVAPESIAPRATALSIVAGELTPRMRPLNPAARSASPKDPPINPTPTMDTVSITRFVPPPSR